MFAPRKRKKAGIPMARARGLSWVLGAGFAAALFLPAGAWAGGPVPGDANGTIVAPGGAVLTLVGTTTLSDQVLASEMAKGITKPEPSVGQNVQGPQVTLWDDIQRPGSAISSGSIDTFSFTGTSVWH